MTDTTRITCSHCGLHWEEQGYSPERQTWWGTCPRCHQASGEEPQAEPEQEL